MLTKSEQDTVRDAVLWMDEHANYMDRAVIDGYRGIQDGLASLLPEDPRPMYCEECEAPITDAQAKLSRMRYDGACMACQDCVSKELTLKREAGERDATA